MAQIVVSARAVEKIQREVATLDKDIAKKQERRAGLLRRIDAMNILLGGAARNGYRPKTDDAVATTPAPTTHQLKLGETLRANDDGPSVPMVVKQVLNEKGRMGAVELRKAIIAAGVPRERLGATYSYVYTVLGRLMQRGQIIRARGKYQLPEGVTIQTNPEVADLTRS